MSRYVQAARRKAHAHDTRKQDSRSARQARFGNQDQHCSFLPPLPTLQQAHIRSPQPRPPRRKVSKHKLKTRPPHHAMPCHAVYHASTLPHPRINASPSAPPSDHLNTQHGAPPPLKKKTHQRVTKSISSSPYLNQPSNPIRQSVLQYPDIFTNKNFPRDWPAPRKSSHLFRKPQVFGSQNVSAVQSHSPISMGSNGATATATGTGTATAAATETGAGRRPPPFKPADGCKGDIGQSTDGQHLHRLRMRTAMPRQEHNHLTSPYLNHYSTRRGRPDSPPSKKKKKPGQ